MLICESYVIIENKKEMLEFMENSDKAFVFLGNKSSGMYSNNPITEKDFPMGFCNKGRTWVQMEDVRDTQDKMIKTIAIGIRKQMELLEKVKELELREVFK